jgi:hypothetical protein
MKRPSSVLGVAGVAVLGKVSTTTRSDGKKIATQPAGSGNGGY